MKETLETDGETVVVFSNDTDVFCLLIRHALEYKEKKTYTSAAWKRVEELENEQFITYALLLVEVLILMLYTYYSHMRLVDAIQHPA